MASDLKIEIFACTLFYKIWLQMDMVKTKPDILQIYGEECCKVEKIYEACDDLFIKPVICRRKLFKRIYLEDFTDEKAKSLKSLSECYNYVISTCDRNDFFGELTVFEKMFATCAFVLDFCIRIHQYKIVDVIEYGHMFWAMYFDKFTKEFYERGGWPELKVVAETYSGLDDFFCWFKEESFFELRDAIDNYFYFIGSNQYDEFKSNQKKEIHASKLWIKFRIEQFESYLEFTDQYPYEAHEVEYLLEDLKEIFEIILEESAVVTDIEFSEVPTDHTDNKTSTNEDLGIKHLPERKCETSKTSEVQSTNQMNEILGYRKPPPYNFPHATILCSENEGANGNKEVKTEKTLETSSSLKNGNDWREIDNRTRAIPTSHISESECNGNIDNLYSRNRERQFDTSNATEVLSTNQMDKSSHYRKPHSCRVPELTNLCSQNAVVSDSVEEVNKEKTLEVTHYSKNGDDQTEIVKRTKILSASQMAKYELNGNSSAYILPERQFIDTYVDNLYSSNTERPRKTPNAPEVLSTIEMAESERDGKTTPDNLPKVLNPVNRCENTGNKMENVDRAREDLRNEQDDHFINIFLRMILVLGDRQGTKFVFQALQRIKEGPEKAQVIPHKTKKKKSKRKRKSKKNKDEEELFVDDKNSFERGSEIP